ncbi:MAG: rhamnulokinase, partial [Oscillospiraceae bacterium]|nr:rhamnulokinase [Oscillospiraceae bacterium]
MKCYLAIDIGASSGRHIVGWREKGEIRTEEVYRFPNGVTEMGGHLTWDMEALLAHVKKGIDVALTRFSDIVSLSIDTWGCDYVLLRGDEEVRPCYAYRDSRTEEAVPGVHEKVPFDELYCRTGCQFQSFNTIYQLCSDKLAGRLEGVTDFLMVPEYLMWKLTGIKAKEYTNATTTGLVNAQTGEFDRQLAERLGLPTVLFPKLSRPGTAVGEYEGIKVVLCATHDTASAVEGIPMEGNQSYISSGTWSLLGVKTEVPITDARSRMANYSNEGGVGYNRYQKNIMGMWLVNELKRELGDGLDFDGIVRSAEMSRYDGLVDANAPIFLSPKSMAAAMREALTKEGYSLPEQTADYFRCAYRSLAESYRKAILELEENTGKQYEKLYIVGGGAKNRFLNHLTEEATGKEVVALPIEATALG